MIAQIENVLALRQHFWANGFRPIPIWNPDERLNDAGEPLVSPGKQPRGYWIVDARQTPPVATRSQPDRRALNTGILCDQICGIDIDILDQHLVDKTVELIEAAIGPTFLMRVGRAPKLLLVYRWAQPFRKIKTPELFLPDGSKCLVEVLADGQQFVADGTHPDTGLPYRWIDESPETVHLSSLPVVSEEQARTIVADIERMLRDAGATPKETGTRNGAEHPATSKPRTTNGAGDFFRQVNDTALAARDRWVKLLFPKARFEPGTGAWRVSSKDLGRNFQEDISLHPAGIQDWGEDAGQTAIDLVMRHGAAASAIDAALWLCSRMGIEPTSLGYATQKPKLTPQPKHSPNQQEDGWIPPSTNTWPAPLGPAAYHGVAGDFVSLIEPHTEADPAAIMFQFLTAAGNCFGARAAYYVEETAHFPNIFTLIVGDTAKARKGTSLG